MKFHNIKRNQKKDKWFLKDIKKILGDVLFLPTLSSALKSLTSVFGMGTGVPSSLLSPRKINLYEIVLSKLR